MIRGLRWLATIWCGLVIVLLVPTLVVPGAIAVAGAATSPAEMGFDPGRVIVVSATWSAGIATLAVLLGWGPGRFLARSGARWAMLASLVPLVVPPSLFFDAWWLETGPDGPIGRAAAVAGAVPRLRAAVLAVGLACVAWPIVAWCVAIRGVGRDDQLLELDRPRLRDRLRASLRRDWKVLLLGWSITFAWVASLTVPFDLAQVSSWGFELRTLDARGATPATVLRAGVPALVPAIIAGILIAFMTGRRDGPVVRACVAARGGIWMVVVVVLLVLLPLGFLLRRAASADVGTTFEVHGAAIGNTFQVFLVAGLIGGVLAAGIAAIGRDRRGRTVARIAVLGFAVVLLLPATLVAVGVEATWNHAIVGWVYDAPLGMLLGVTGRVGLVACLVGVVVGRRIPPVFEADAPRRMIDVLRGLAPTLRRASIVGGLATGAMAAGEIPVTARIQPPGFPTVTSALLNAMHYQYVDSVLPAVFGLVAMALVAAVLLASLGAVPRLRGVVVRVAPAFLATLPILVFGCSDRGDGEGVRPVPSAVVFGRAGNIDGRFDYPRAIGLDAERGRIYVVDKTARVQRFDLEGVFERSWAMPRSENGKPTGVTIDGDGRVVVADTHEHRIAIFSPDGELLETFGEYGEGPGQFIYPTDVAIASDGTWFVSEYGGNDRVQLFDSDRRPIGSIGFMGHDDEGDSPGLLRPQSIAWDDEAGELYIADAVNHRIVVTDRAGRMRRVLGGAGDAPGRLAYPYGIALDGERSLIVAEYGNNRVQRLDRLDGECLGVWGGAGIEAGRLRYPWGVDAGGGMMAVLDSGNDRVQVGELP